MTETIVTQKSIEETEDLLDRSATAEKYLDIILGQDANVFSINAPWGAGKTFLLNLMEKKAKLKHCFFVKYNAWESDYMENPMIPLAVELRQALLSHPKLKDQKKEITDFFKENALRLIRSVSITAQVGPIGATLDLGKFFEDDTKDNEYKLLYSFRANFRAFLAGLQEKTGYDILIVIDELDRCRPTYAIRTLEVLKHFFQGENGENLGIKFVLAVDKKQLQNTVTVLYGANADTDCYLRKFVDMELHIKMPNVEEFVKHQLENIKYEGESIIERLTNTSITELVFMWDGKGENLIRNNSSSAFIDRIVEYCKKFDFKLRDIEKFCLKLNIILSQFKIHVFLDFLLVLLAIWSIIRCCY